MGRLAFPSLPIRIGVLTLMLLVALAAGGIYAYMKVSELITISSRNRGKARANSVSRIAWEKQINKQTNPTIKAWITSLAHYHRGLEEKYLRAAERPWVVVEPDPPRPRSPLPDLKASWDRTQDNQDLEERKIPKHDYF